MDKWVLVNRLRMIIMDGKAADINCPDCKKPITFLIGEDDEPIMYCPWCGATFLPGVQFWSDVKAIVSEHYV